MTTYKKTTKPPAVVKGPPLSATGDNTRSFDARPKPSKDHRREESVRPGQHIDQPRGGPLLDEPYAEDTSEG